MQNIVDNKRMSDVLQFYDAFIKGDDMYFSARNTNGLFCHDFVTQKTNLITVFEQETPGEKDLHHQIIAIDNKLYFIPFMGRGISKFDLDTGKMEFIKLFQNGVNSIASAFLYEGKLLLIPMHCLEQLSYLDLDTDEIEEIDISELKEAVGNERDINALFDLQGACLIDKQLILVLYNRDCYFEIDLDSMEVQKYTVEAGAKLDNVFFDGCDLWINSAISTEVYRIVYETRQIKKYNIPDINRCKRPFYSVNRINGKLILLPYEEQMIYWFNEEEDSWSRLEGIDWEEKRKLDLSCPLSWRIRERNNKYLLFPVALKEIYALNDRLELEEKIMLIPSDEMEMKGLNKKYFQYCIDNGNILKEEKLCLQEYIWCVDQNTCFSSEEGSCLKEKFDCFNNV